MTTIVWAHVASETGRLWPLAAPAGVVVGVGAVTVGGSRDGGW